MPERKAKALQRGALLWITTVLVVAACDSSSDSAGQPPDDGSAPGDRDADSSTPGPGNMLDGGRDAARSSSDSGQPGGDCDRPGLVWKSARKTNYESYPAPGSDECVKYKGCAYLGQFQACSHTMPESWVRTHDIASVYPLAGLELHKLCVRAGSKSMSITAIDTCADSDCSGCCTQNRGQADLLIDLEKYTNERFGVEDGEVEWADLGAAESSFDGCN